MQLIDSVDHLISLQSELHIVTLVLDENPWPLITNSKLPPMLPNF